MGMGGSMTLSGTFKATIASHDGSHRCVAATSPEGSMTGEVVEPSGPPGCEVDSCDGPCCPYGMCMASCLMTCAQEKCMNPATMMECAKCEPDCMDECDVSQDCRSAYTALGQCAMEHQCEPGPLDENPCIGTHCCPEFDAAF